MAISAITSSLPTSSSHKSDDLKHSYEHPFSIIIDPPQSSATGVCNLIGAQLLSPPPPVSTSSASRVSLHQAIQTNHLAVVKGALHAGAKPKKNTLTIACAKASLAIIQLLISVGALPDKDTLKVACRRAEAKYEGGDVVTLDPEGVAIFDAIFATGALSDAETLEIANATLHSGIVEQVLFRQKIFPSNILSRLFTYPQAELSYAYMDISHVYIKAGALPDANTLHFAIYRKPLEFLQRLVEIGAKPKPIQGDFNIYLPDTWSTLFYAAYKRRDVVVVKFLLAQGCILTSEELQALKRKAQEKEVGATEVGIIYNLLTTGKAVALEKEKCCIIC